MIEQGVIYVLAGVSSGLLSGVLGVGGGMITVPILLYLFHQMQTIPGPLQMQVAAGNSLAIMIFTAQASMRAHLRQNTILWSVFYRLCPGIIFGALIGSLLAHLLTTHLLEKFLGFMLLFILLNLLFNITKTYPDRFPNRFIQFFISSVIGLLSGLLGIGGGTLLIPYLTHCGVDTRQISPAANICTLTVAVVGTCAFILTGRHVAGLPPYSTGYIYWPAVLCISIPSMIAAPIGTRLIYTLPIKHLKYLFAMVLLIASVSLLI